MRGKEARHPPRKQPLPTSSGHQRAEVGWFALVCFGVSDQMAEDTNTKGLSTHAQPASFNFKATAHKRNSPRAAHARKRTSAETHGTVSAVVRACGRDHVVQACGLWCKHAGCGASMRA
jgi:hypothetical protein